MRGTTNLTLASATLGRLWQPKQGRGSLKWPRLHIPQPGKLERVEGQVGNSRGQGFVQTCPGPNLGKLTNPTGMVLGVPDSSSVGRKMKGRAVLSK